MGEVIDLFTGQRQELSPERKAHLIQRITDMAIEISLLESEKERLTKVLNGEA